MGNRKISDEVKAVALRLRAYGDSDKEVCHITNISISTLTRIRRCHLCHRTVAKAAAIGRSWPRHLVTSDCRYLLNLA
jgi:hypothetical protein